MTYPWSGINLILHTKNAFHYHESSNGLNLEIVLVQQSSLAT